MLSILASFLLGVTQVDSGPPRPITQMVHTRWTARDGAPMEIRALAQTSNGYLWLGTRSGLFRFDGMRFVRFAPRERDTIPSGAVDRLTATRDGGLWLVFRSGSVSRLSTEGRLTSFGPQDGLPATFQVAESRTGSLVAGTANGLSRFKGGRWEGAPAEWQFPGTRAQNVWFDGADGLWAESHDRFVYLPADGRRFQDPDMRLRGTASAGDFAEARDGRIWFSEVMRSAHTVPRVGEERPIAEVLVGARSLLIDRKGSLWIGTLGDGLRRVPDPTALGRVTQFGPGAEQFTEKDGLLSNIVRALLEDREGNIWIATDRGLERFRESVFTTIPSGTLRARFVFGTRDSSVWSAAINQVGIVRYGRLGQDTIPTDFLVSSAYEDTAGVVWTVNGTILAQYRGGRWSDVIRPGISNRTLTAVTVDRAGIMWLFDPGFGLLRLTRDSLVPVVPFPPSRFPHSLLYADREGRIWVGQVGSVGVYHNGRLQLFGAAEGAGAEFNAFMEDRNGNIWIGTDNGLSKFADGRFRTLSGHQGLPGRAVRGIAADDEGAWWVVTPTGVHRLAPNEAERAFADSTHVLAFRSFDFLDGLPGVPIGAYGPQIARSADGRIWVASDSGVAHVDPRKLPRGAIPQVLIESVRAGGRGLNTLESLEIPPRSGDLEIDYTATSLSIPERVRFRYRLEGSDQSWHDVEARRTAYYAGLAPGSYRFEVSAHNGDGTWSETGTVLDFRVLPAWHQTLWFKAAAVLLTLALVSGATVLGQRRRHLRSQASLRAQYEATLAERARIAQDLHDTLLQGFAGVTLQLEAAELALPEQPDVATETILRVQYLARASLKEARERVWDMRETEVAGSDLPAALERIAHERTTGTGIEVSMRTFGEQRRLSHEVHDAAFRIGREAIVNVVRHAEAHRIEIQVEFDPRVLRLEVRDDGRGLAADDVEQASHRGHFGLSGARERASRLGGRCDALARPGGGTIIALQLPVSQQDGR
jgi:signal transduction histidine kinase/ligand-binding sensor domain-containing protein